MAPIPADPDECLVANAVVRSEDVRTAKAIASLVRGFRVRGEECPALSDGFTHASNGATFTRS